MIPRVACHMQEYLTARDPKIWSAIEHSEILFCMEHNAVELLSSELECTPVSTKTMLLRSSQPATLAASFCCR